MTNFYENMGDPIIGINPNKRNETQKQSPDLSYISRIDRTYYDTQNTCFNNSKKTAEQIQELMEDAQKNGIIDQEKYSALQYQLMCQSMWLNNAGRGEYNRFRV